MISMIIPTRNRAYTLRKVLPSYFSQNRVSEVILVIDGGSDETPEVFSDIAAKHPDVSARMVVNETRRGASQSRQRGAEIAHNEHLLFCDDDEYLEAGYAEHCLDLLKSADAGAVSGRRVYMRSGESCEAALARFGNGNRAKAPFNLQLMEVVNGAIFTGHRSLPFTNANIVTRKSYVERFKFDDFYSQGSGYREESDYQIKLFLSDIPVLVSNEKHSLHLPAQEVSSGGQRTGRLSRLRWSLYYNNYFLNKYYKKYIKKTGMRSPLWWAKLSQGVFLAWRELVRPFAYRAVMALRK